MRMRFLVSVLLLVLASSVFATGTSEAVGEEEETLVYSYFPGNDSHSAAIQTQPPNDVVGPYLEERFNIQLGDVIQAPTGASVPQAVAMWVAADALPDVMRVGVEHPGVLAATGSFADLTPYIEEMPNYQRLYPQEYWPRSTVDGKLWSIQSIESPYNPDGYIDPYSVRMSHAIWLREDILAMLDYEFTPVSELREKTDNGIMLTEEDLAISPPIDTPEALMELLQQVQDLELTVNGLPLIPMSIQPWLNFHFGNMFDFGHYRLRDGDVAGWWGSPGTYALNKWFWEAYTSGLLDQDYVIQKSEQLMEKVSQGRVFASATLPDAQRAFQAAQSLDPSIEFRFIPWPKTDPDWGFFDVVRPEGFWNHMIRADMPESNIERLTQFWDWLGSEEGNKIMSWGPPSAGLYTETNGDRQFVDPEVAEDVLQGIRNERGADYWGLAAAGSSGSSFSPIVLAAPSVVNDHAAMRSYPLVIDIYAAMSRVSWKNGVNWDGRAAYNDNTSLTANVQNWFWSEFQNQKIAQLLNAEDEADFDAAFAALQAEFYDTSNYEAAIKAMEEYFDKYPPLR